MKKSAIPAALFTVLALLGVAALAQNRQVTATQRSEWIKFNPVTPLTAASFADPPAADWPWARMNMPATADPAGAAAGGWKRAANQVGIKVSLSHGPTQNPAGYSIDDDHARKTLVVGKAVVNAAETFDGHLPPPTLTAGGRSGFGGLPGGRGQGAGAAGRGPGGAGGRAAGGPPAAGGVGGRGGPGGRGAAPQPSRATLIAVLAYRCTLTPCPAAVPAELDRSSVIDLTAAVTGKNTDRK